MKLYQLSDDIRLLSETLEESGADHQTIIDTIDGSTELMDFEQKAEGIIKMVKNWEADMPGLQAEIDRLTAIKASQENRIKSVKSYLKLCMEAAKIEKVKIGSFNARIQRNSRGSVIIEDENKVPAAYIDIIPEQKIPNKDRLYEALKAGKDVSGVRYEVGTHLRVG